MVFDFDDLAAAEKVVEGQRGAVADAGAVGAEEVALRVVRGLSGDVLCLVTAGPATSVRALKACVAQRAKIPASEQRLLIGGRRLCDEELLGDAIAAGSADAEVALVRIDPARARIVEDLQRGRVLLGSLEQEMRDDVEVVLAALDGDRFALQHAGATARRHRPVVLRAVRRNGMALQHVSEELRADGEVVRAAVRSAASAFQYAAEAVRGDREVVLYAVRESGEALRYASGEIQDDRSVVIAAVRQDGLALEHASDPLRDDEEVVLAAVQQRGMALKHAGERARGNQRIVLAAIESSCGSAIEFASEAMKCDRGTMLAAVRREALTLQHAPAALLRDREVVLCAVSATGLLLSIAAEELRRDREVVLAAVSDHGHALQHAADSLRDDKEVVLTAVAQDGTSLRYSSWRLRGQREVVVAAIANNADALRFAVDEALHDREVVLAAVKRDLDAVRFATPELIADPVFRASAGALGAFKILDFEEMLVGEPEAMEGLLEQGLAVFVDARNQPEFDRSHINGAQLLPPEKAGELASSDGPQLGALTDRPEQTLVVYSDNGLSNSRCVSVARALRRSPHIQPHRVLRLTGGLNAWKTKGFAVEGDARAMLLGEVISERELKRVLVNLIRLETGGV